MAASDYTDGGGWAKLDQAACDRIAEIVATFSPAYMATHTRMLLTLYRSLDKDGTITIGYRKLAERAGVTERAAYKFIEKMEKGGVLVRVGERKTPAGDYTVRRFYWMEGATQEGSTPATQKAPSGKHPRYLNRGVWVAHQSSTELSEGACGSATAAPPTPDDGTEHSPRRPSITDAMPWEHRRDEG